MIVTDEKAYIVNAKKSLRYRTFLLFSIYNDKTW